MNFQSIHFALFLLALFLLTRFVFRSNEAKKNLLLFASYYFYSCWDWRFSALLLSISVLNFYIGIWIHHASTEAHRKIYLALSLIGSLSVLGFFKYFNFFIDSLNQFTDLLGLSSHIELLKIILPVGISFYTFQSLSYTLDIFRKKMEPIRSLRDFTLFVSFFPQLVAGPIVRAKDFLPQLQLMKDASDQEIQEGFILILRGLIKKIIFADALAKHFVDPAFQSPESFSSTFLILAAFAYSFQVYFDFSAYTDMARGSARILGYELPVNFKRPYAALTISNFWQRWHISMSSFFRDYLYFGIGGSKSGNVYINLLITFVAIGVWHGAGWNFVVYGALHGSMVGFERYLRGRRKRLGIPEPQYANWLARCIKIFWIFTIVTLARILFRAGSLEQAWDYTWSMLTSTITALPISFIAGVLFVLSVVLHYVPQEFLRQTGLRLARSPVILQTAIFVGVLISLAIFGEGSAPFIYFQF